MAKHSTNKTLFSKKTIEFEDKTDYVTISQSENDVISGLNLEKEYTVESWISTTEIPEDPTFTYASDVASALKENSTLTLSGTVNVNDLYESDLLYAVKHDGTEITLKNKTSDKFPVGARILIIEMQALSSSTQSTVGNYEFVEVDSHISDDEIKFKNALTKTFDFSNRLYVVYQKRYNKIEIERNARIICDSWATNFNEINGLILLCADEIIVEGTIDANNRGFRGGNSGPHGDYNGGRGEGIVHGLYNNRNSYANYTGGGGGAYKRHGGGDVGTGGGSGGNASKGYNSYSFQGAYGRGGSRNAYPDGKLFLGGGGGQGAGDGAWPAETCKSRGGNGGRGGGIIILDAENTHITKLGSVVVKGQQGFSYDLRCSGEPGHGGAGAGGSIAFMGNVINDITGLPTGDSNVCAKGGVSRGGGASTGREGGLGIIQSNGYHTGWMQGWMGHKFHNCSVIASFARPFGKTGDIDDYNTEKNRHAFLLTAIPFEDGYKLVAGQSHRMLPVGQKLEFDRFYHFVISRNSTSLEAIYIDGKRKGIRTWPSNHVYENSNIMLGANSDNDFENPAPFTGFIQDFRVAQNNMYDCTSYTLGDASNVPSESCTDPTPSPSKSPSYSKSASASFEFPDGCPTRVVPYWGGTSGGGTRSGPSNLENAFDGKDSSRTGWVTIRYSGSWKQDRFYFSDSNKQTAGTLRFYMQGGVNSGYGNRADMYIRYHEYGGDWVYLRNVKNSYMPRDQHFKYEIRVNSVARVDVYWKDIGKGSINYFYWYIDFEQDCYPLCDNSIFHIQAKGNEPLKDRSTNLVPIEEGFEGYLPSLPNVPAGISTPSIIMDARFSNASNLINNATLEGSYSIQGNTTCQQSLRFANSGGYAYFDNWYSEPQTLSFEIDFKINSNSNSVAGGASTGSQFILYMQNREEESNTAGLSLSYIESNKSLSMTVTSDPPSEPTAVTDGNDLVLGERVHVIVTISSDTIKIYVNGVESASETKDNGIDYHPTNKLTLGRANLLGNDFDSYMNGDIYNFRLWDNLVLNSSQVEELYELRNTKVSTCDQAGVDLGHSSFAISEDKFIIGDISATSRKLKVDEDFTIEFRVSIKDFEIAPSVSDLGAGNNIFDPVGNIIFAGAVGTQGIVGVGITKEKYFYTGFDGSQNNDASKFMIDETERSLNTTYSVALNYRSNILSLFVNGYIVKSNVVTFNDDAHMDAIVVGANDALDYFSSHINIQDVRIVQESLYDRDYYKPRTFLTDPCENVRTPTPTPTLTYVGRTITIAQISVDDDSEMNNVFAKVFVNDTGPNPNSSNDYWGYSINGGPVLRVLEGFTVDFTYLVDGTHTFKVYYFVADGTQTIVSDSSQFTIKSPELFEKCNRYQVERTENLLRTIDIIGKCSIVVQPNYFKYESIGLSVQTANIVVNDTNGNQIAPTDFKFRNIIEVTSNTASKNTVLVIDSGGANVGNVGNLNKSIIIQAFGEVNDVNGWVGDNIDIITTDISNKNYLTSNNSRTFVNPGNCEHASHYTVDLSHIEVTLNSRPRSALSHLNMLSSDMVSNEIEVHTIDKSNSKLVPLYSLEDTIDRKLLSQSTPQVGLLPNIVLELDNVGGDSANINETNDQPNRIFITTLNKQAKKSSFIVNSGKIIVNNNETN